MHISERSSWTAQREDGSQILVALYPDGAMKIAERANDRGVWGPPVPIVRTDWGDGVVQEASDSTRVVDMTERTRVMVSLYQRYATPSLQGDLGLATAAGIPHRYLLIEKNAKSHTPAHWLTGHDSPREASLYHLGQEYAEGWEAFVLVDLDTRECMVPGDLLWMQGEPLGFTLPEEVDA